MHPNLRRHELVCSSVRNRAVSAACLCSYSFSFRSTRSSWRTISFCSPRLGKGSSTRLSVLEFHFSPLANKLFVVAGRI